ncbi:MAG: 2-C-methyl-D-erythritol 2,4-cyclodiphosphate synthase [Bacteroidales bacterium]|nr:2-C-methyl-D-erythritol 2,4-cyclodiphosphate synthase [Bacteroidales bacterium]
MKIRVGFGYDMHRLKEGKELWLGGVKLDYRVGLDGHSDADVLIHAICDALLGAANLRDIGFHFPDTSAEYKEIRSTLLLEKTMDLLREHGYVLGNIDATVCAEKPKINPYIPKMQEKLAKVMGVDKSDISIKATTSEKMGFVGREEGITAYVVALIQQ